MADYTFDAQALERCLLAVAQRVGDVDDTVEHSTIGETMAAEKAAQTSKSSNEEEIESETELQERLERCQLLEVWIDGSHYFDPSEDSMPLYLFKPTFRKSDLEQALTYAKKRGREAQFEIQKLEHIIRRQYINELTPYEFTDEAIHELEFDGFHPFNTMLDEPHKDQKADENAPGLRESVALRKAIAAIARLVVRAEMHCVQLRIAIGRVQDE